MKKWLLILLFAFCASAAAQETKLKPGATEGATISVTKARHSAFCEIYVGFGRIGPTTGVQIYNSVGTTGPDSGCPAEAFAALDRDKVAAHLHASIVILNPRKPTARRWWVMDELYFYTAGQTFDFGGVKATWVLEMPLENLLAAAKASKVPYQVFANSQLSKWVFKKGNTVFLLRAPEGKVYVMQSYTTVEDPNLTYEQLPKLGSKLQKLPPGWKYEVKTLTQDLEVEFRKTTPASLKHLTLDEFGNMYLGCGFDSACNYIP